MLPPDHMVEKPASPKALKVPDFTLTPYVLPETTGMSPSAPLLTDWCIHGSISYQKQSQKQTPLLVMIQSDPVN